jgi:hypothetical protein
VGLAGAPIPFWLTVLAGRREPAALRAELSLLALARRLTSEGFEPTMFSGVTELAPGRISVLGLAHDESVVAVEVMGVAPWIIPYSDQGPWAADGEPREVPLTAGARVTLKAMPPPDEAQKERRTVVFRGAQKP